MPTAEDTADTQPEQEVLERPTTHLIPTAASQTPPSSAASSK